MTKQAFDQVGGASEQAKTCGTPVCSHNGNHKSGFFLKMQTLVPYTFMGCVSESSSKSLYQMSGRMFERNPKSTSLHSDLCSPVRGPHAHHLPCCCHLVTRRRLHQHLPKACKRRTMAYLSKIQRFQRFQVEELASNPALCATFRKPCGLRKLRLQAKTLGDNCCMVIYDHEL